MDIKRVAFETRAVKSARPAVNAQQQSTAPMPFATPSHGGDKSNEFSARNLASAGTINREEIANIVDRFLANRRAGNGAPDFAPEHVSLHATSSPAPAQPGVDVEAGSQYAVSTAAPHAEAAPTATSQNGDNANGNEINNSRTGARDASISTAPQQAPAAPPHAQQSATSPTSNGTSANGTSASGNGHKRTVDFVCEDDVRRAIQKGEKIYVNARTIITPAAHDMGDAAEVFAKG